MSDSKSKPRRTGTAQPALQAALTDAATDPVRRAMWLDALEQQLRPCLPPALAPHCRLANVAGKRLVFIVDSPVWNARLRLAAPELINVAQSIGLAVTEVTAKTSLAPPLKPAQDPVVPVSEASRKGLQAALDLLSAPDSADTPTPRGGHRGRRKN
ncbi:DUF721 domain-containing protein [Pseudoxanthomonas sp. PXM02]|uniref:DUF721 domain-containing protein n=1 Tax=Pseudoxanthomonas sp. PXM02 TaxID=2769294 RepID=UPI00177C31C4|nr:DUF721 domain-containing protein [Pseudoxanthomonas sp. PXM02]MBD9478609.1 DUF721 domain-containing protein [Pseudoxanthomonas sp. PXM02]